jgi:hypothetical protein
MAKRSKHDDWIELTAQLTCLVALLGLTWPQVRQIIPDNGFVAFCFLGLVAVNLIVVVVYRFATRSQRAQAVEGNGGCKASGVDVQGGRKQSEHRPL